MNKNIGHGHVFPRPDGVRARCGGPMSCSVCAKDLASKGTKDVIDNTQPSAWEIWWGLGEMARFDRVYRNKQEAEDVAKDIKSYTEVRPLYSIAVSPAAPASVVPSFDRTTALVLLQAASKSGDPGAIGLAAQLAGAAPCKDCGYVNFKCRCQSAAPPAAPAPVVPLSCNKVPPGNGYCDYCARGEYEKCRYTTPAAPVVPLTDERLQKHAMLAGDCPPGSMVVLLSSLRRMLSAAPAAPVVPLTEERLQRAYALGWIAASSWAKRDDLLADMGSAAYVSEMADALQACGIGGGNG